MFAARLKCARQISTALNAAAVYRLRRLLCGRANLWLLARGCCPRTESPFVCCAFQIVQSLNISLLVLAAGSIGRDAVHLLQSVIQQKLTKTIPVDLPDQVIPYLDA